MNGPVSAEWIWKLYGGIRRLWMFYWQWVFPGKKSSTRRNTSTVLQEGLWAAAHVWPIMRDCRLRCRVSSCSSLWVMHRCACVCVCVCLGGVNMRVTKGDGSEKHWWRAHTDVQQMTGWTAASLSTTLDIQWVGVKQWLGKLWLDYGGWVGGGGGHVGNHFCRNT